MKQYNIFFYRSKKDINPISVYSREFASKEELIEWCNSIMNECNYYTYIHQVITAKQFLLNIKNELS